MDVNNEGAYSYIGVEEALATSHTAPHLGGEHIVITQAKAATAPLFCVYLPAMLDAEPQALHDRVHHTVSVRHAVWSLVVVEITNGKLNFAQQ